MTTNAPVIGIDLGGTNLRVGAVQGGAVVGTLRAEIGAARAPEQVVDAMMTLIEQARGLWGAPSAIGVGAPGLVNAETGVIVRSPHFPLWHNVALAHLLQTRVGAPVQLDNDANVIAQGEMLYGAARALTNFVMLTFGTGIGGGIVLNRAVQHGDRGFAGEVGHLVIQFGGPMCPCGGRGCWELYASASGIHRLIDESNDPARDYFLKHFGGVAARVTPADLDRLARDGDIFASTLWKKFGAYVGAGIASLTNILGVDHFVLGGGVSAAWELFINEARRSLAKYTYAETAQGVQLHRAQLGDAAGILGAASLATSAGSPSS